MCVFLVTAHALQNSSHAVLHRTILESLRDAGHDIDVCDLYAENLDPVLDASARERYFDVAVNRTGVVEPYVDRLFRAEALILCSRSGASDRRQS